MRAAGRWVSRPSRAARARWCSWTWIRRPSATSPPRSPRSAASGDASRARDARRFLEAAGEPFDVVFLDPPFAEPVLDAACAALERGGWLAPGGYAYLEAPAAAGPPGLPEGWTLLRSKRAGEVGYHLARRDVTDG